MSPSTSAPDPSPYSVVKKQKSNIFSKRQLSVRNTSQLMKAKKFMTWAVPKVLLCGSKGKLLPKFK